MSNSESSFSVHACFDAATFEAVPTCFFQRQRFLLVKVHANFRELEAVRRLVPPMRVFRMLLWLLTLQRSKQFLRLYSLFFSHDLSVQTNFRAFQAVLTFDSVDKRLSNF